MYVFLLRISSPSIKGYGGSLERNSAYARYLEQKMNYDKQEVFDCNKGITYVGRTGYSPEKGRQSILEKALTYG